MRLMTVEQVIEAASPATVEQYLGTPPYTLVPLQENTYCLHSATQLLFLKLIPPEDWFGHNEIRINQELQTTSFFPAPRLLFTVAIDQATLAGWEWAEGSDLRQRQQGALSLAFAELGRFHAAHRNTRPVCSPTTHQQYESVRAMLHAELALLTCGLERTVVDSCAEAFRRFKVGYVTCIHGDFHPGNIRVTPDGVRFVDWGYATNSLNLFDLGYVQRYVELKSDAAEWWHIMPSESSAVLAAYFATCGMGETDWEPLQWAIEVWSTLYAHRNALIRYDDMGVRDSLGTLYALLAVL